MTSCARDASRIARFLLRRRVDEDPPEACVLRHDRYALDEARKTPVRWNLWRCRVCGKQFSSELYLDRHFDNRHPPNATKPCIADLCPALDCAAAPTLARTPLARASSKRRVGRRDRGRSKRRAARYAVACEDPADAIAQCRKAFGDCGLDLATCDRLVCDAGRLRLDDTTNAPLVLAPPSQQGTSPAVVALYAVFLIIFYVFLALQTTDHPPRRRPPRTNRRPPRTNRRPTTAPKLRRAHRD